MPERDDEPAVELGLTTSARTVQTIIDWNANTAPPASSQSLQTQLAPTAGSAATTAGTDSVRVLMAVAEPLVARGLRALIEGSAETRFAITEVDDEPSLLAALDGGRADVCLLDGDLPGPPATEVGQLVAAVRARQADCAVLVLTREPRLEDVLSALEAGAGGVIAQADEIDLVAALRAVASGLATLSGQLLESIVGQLPPRSDESLAEVAPQWLQELTPRELEVLRCIAAGMLNGDIAEHLTLSTSTVKTHVGRIFSKLDVSDRAQAVVAAFSAGVTDPPAGGDRRR
ncbi:MAG: response regulator transcription factor [Solirubrobacteraceae bacterium]|nr:response regulator transcription factor [Solirubrobacteraceae bacterium]